MGRRESKQSFSRFTFHLSTSSMFVVRQVWASTVDPDQTVLSLTFCMYILHALGRGSLFKIVIQGGKLSGFTI